ncbi:MFS transporter [Lentzea sp. NPDC004782]|uniref:MFS transporter n=1 Tax=Lentzea sp. NPDC004782 TaxID=3154458 RepID=UPI0033A1D305
MDATAVALTLPVLRRDLDVLATVLPWVASAYGLALASLLVLFGGLADRLGRRRVFRLGLLVFAAGAATCSIAPDHRLLIAGRVVQGIGASMLTPVSLSIVLTVFPTPEQRAGALGVWGSVMGTSMASGPLVSGAVVQAFGWHAVFYAIAVLTGAVFVAATVVIPESTAPRTGRVDPVGHVVVVLLFFALVRAVAVTGTAGLVWASVALVLAGALVGHGLRSRDPFVEPRLFRITTLWVSALAAVALFVALGGFLLRTATYWQDVRGLSAMPAGWMTLPMPLMINAVRLALPATAGTARCRSLPDAWCSGHAHGRPDVVPADRKLNDFPRHGRRAVVRCGVRPGQPDDHQAGHLADRK